MRQNIIGIAALFLMAAATIAHAGTVTYVYSDPQGTPLAEADSSGNITATFDYRPYGAQALGSSKDGPGYTGHVNDEDSGLIYMQARYYDSQEGIFFSIDPVSFAVGGVFKFGRYAYASDNPIANIDPTGADDCGYHCMQHRKQSDAASMFGAIGGSYDPITDSQRKYAQQGQLAFFWRDRYKSGDPWAASGLSLWDSSNKALSGEQRFLGQFNLFRLKNALWERDRFSLNRDSQAYVVEIRTIGKQIAIAYIATVDNNRGYVPTLSQSVQFHADIFQEHHLSTSTYGGAPLGSGSEGAERVWGNVQAAGINWVFGYCEPGCKP